MSTDPPHAIDPPPKAVLFCPNCGHESPLDGDWRRRERPDGPVYECPDCHTAVTDRRPRVGADGR